MSKPLLILVYFLLIILGCQPAEQNQPIDINELTIAEIQKGYADRTLTSVQLVAAYLERINQYDGLINSITQINPDALSIAKALDEENQKTGVLRPLHGIPLIVKDNINTKGLSTTAGSLALKDFITGEDAFIIEKLIKAGAIIIAKSNMAEWAATPWGSFSSTNGATLNAYNVDYSPAGSSGGTGSSIAANFGVIGLGTDTGGSIRLPASHGSLVGLRPTMGLVSRSGIIPAILQYDMPGPICRTVEDATRVLEVIAGNDNEDPLTKYSNGKIPNNYIQFLQDDGLKGARIGVLREIGETNPDTEILVLFEKAIMDMKSMGAQIIDSVHIADFDSLSKNEWCEEFKHDLEIYLASYVKNDTIKTLEDIIRIGTKSEFTAKMLDFDLAKMIEHPEIKCLDVYSDQNRIALRMAVEKQMDLLNLDALIYPTWNVKPYKMDSIVEEYVGSNTAIIAPPTGQPAISVPMGFMQDNLPTGIEFLGRMYSEPTLIKLAYSYEQGTKHRRSPDLEKAITKDKIH
jgi:Asp-tRNA(Asn)/Glu-tRNA(Gln) amidotransferase A subunit family amidase